MDYHIEKPDISTVSQNRILELLERQDVKEIAAKSLATTLYWDKLKREPMPSGVSSEEIWAVVKFLKQNFPSFLKKKSIVKSTNGESFSWLEIPILSYEVLRRIDMSLGGNLIISNFDITEGMRNRLIVRGVMEEAIASSQIEGANTTREAAQKLLQEGRKPRTKAEQMILNNYRTMKAIEEEYKGKALSVELLLSLHKMLTENTLDNREKEGKFRTDSDRVVVQNALDGTVYFRVPRIEFVNKEIERLMKYANDQLSDSDFVHPVVKAIILHFWIGYLHPFVDGNGRLARALFYWYVLRNDLWGFAYIPLSKLIKNSPDQYGMSYLYAEQDDYDLTYFLSYNIKKILQAIKEFHEYLKQQEDEVKVIAKVAKSQYGFNERQIELVRLFLKNKNASTSIKTYRNINQVSRLTAFKDLKQLVKLGFTEGKRIGRELHYFPTEKLKTIFR